MERVDYIIGNADVITMAGAGAGVIEDGAVAVKGSRIAAVGKTAEIEQKYKADKWVDGRNMAVMPGLIDAHIHTGLAILRGVAQDMHNWMEQGLWPYMKHVTNEDRKKGSLMNIIEGIKAGTTTFADYDSHMPDLVQNYALTGARARVAEMVNEMPAASKTMKPGDLYPLDLKTGEEKLQRNIELFDKWHGAEDGRITCLLGPQGPDMMSLELLKEMQKLAEKYDTKLHMHVCQGDREIYQMEKRYGKRSIPFLEENGLLNERLLAVHLTEADPEETETVARSGASMINCSGSIGIIDGIVPPVKKFMDAGGKAALGSDQAPGNNCNNMFNEMKFVSILNKVKAQDPSVFPAVKALRMATVEAAEVLGIGHETGSIEHGKKADLIMVDLMEPAMSPVIRRPVRNIIPNLVYSANGSEVKHVMVDGRFIMKNRELMTVDEKTAVQEAHEAAEGVSRRVAEEGASGLKLMDMMARDEL